MRNRKLLSCVMAVSVIAVTAWFCSQMSTPHDELNLCAESDAISAVDIGAVQAISLTSFVQSEYTEPVSVNAAHADVMTAVKVIEQHFFLLEIPLPENLQAVMQEACIEYNVPYSLALAVTEIESAFDVDADNGLCVGLMQINECNHEWLRKLSVEPTEYEGNITAGVLMLGELLEKYQDTHKALMAYNCGEAGASRLWKQGYETSRYSRKVVEAAQLWQLIIDNN